MLPTGKGEDLIIFVVIPLMVFTAMDLWSHRKAIFDANLTDGDSQSLLRAALFLILPIVVFLHECGHAAMTLYFGGTIKEFHYGILWGYVIPNGSFTDAQMLLIYVAGNAVSVLCGLILLIAGTLVSAPAIVALLVYSGLWSLCSAIILYPILSITTLTGDWIAIYTSPALGIVAIVLVVHLILLSFTIWAGTSVKARLWFLSRIRKDWFAQYTRLQADKTSISTGQYAQRVAGLYLSAGLIKPAQKELAAADFTDPETMFLQALLLIDTSKKDEAIIWLKKVDDCPETRSELKGQALRTLGKIYLSDLEKGRARFDRKDPLWQNSMNAFVKGSSVEPEVADSRFYQAFLLIHAGAHQEGLAILYSLSEFTWCDKALAGEVEELLKEAQEKSKPT